MQLYQSSLQNSSENVLKSDSDFINASADAAEGEPETQSLLPDTVGMFHPSTRGHAKIRDVVVKTLNDNGILGEKKDPPAKAPYAEGIYCFHAAQWNDWNKGPDEAAKAELKRSPSGCKFSDMASGSP